MLYSHQEVRNMKATTILKTLMTEQGIGNTVLGKRIGVKHDAVYQRLHQENISVNALNQMLSAMDYKIVIVPATRRMKDDEYEVTMADQEEA